MSLNCDRMLKCWLVYYCKCQSQDLATPTVQMWLDIGMLPYKIKCTITGYTGYRVIGYVIIVYFYCPCYNGLLSEWAIVGYGRLY